MDENGIRCIIKEHMIPQFGLDEIIPDPFLIRYVNGRTDNAGRACHGCGQECPDLLPVLFL